MEKFQEYESGFLNAVKQFHCKATGVDKPFREDLLTAAQLYVLTSNGIPDRKHKKLGNERLSFCNSGQK